MFDFHKDKAVYFTIQYKTCKEYVLPFIESAMDISKPIKVLEIGCAEAGVLKAFTEKGHTCVGVELSESRVKLAEQFMADEVKNGSARFISKNIFDLDLKKDIGFTFDLILLKDVIEHIHNQEKFMAEVGRLLSPGGKIFFGFPPWQMPFGGHQQICRNKFLSVLPYYHLLPRFLYKGVLKIFGEKPKRIEDLLEIKDTGISLERFERIVKKTHFSEVRKQLFFINPIYKYKFGLKVRRQNRILGSIPILRNFISTCGYYLVEKSS